jgi:hypothetical protein
MAIKNISGERHGGGTSCHPLREFNLKMVVLDSLREPDNSGRLFRQQQLIQR